VLGLLTTILGTGLNAFSQAKSAKNSKIMTEEEARSLEEQALVAEREGGIALARGNRQALEALGGGTQTLQGQTLAGVGSGLSGDSDIFGNLQNETMFLSGLDSFTARENARGIYDAEMQRAGGLRTRARNVRAQGQQSYKDAMLGAYGSLATGGIQAFSEFKNVLSQQKQAKALAGHKKMLASLPPLPGY